MQRPPSHLARSPRERRRGAEAAQLRREACSTHFARLGLFVRPPAQQQRHGGQVSLPRGDVERRRGVLRGGEGGVSNRLESVVNKPRGSFCVLTAGSAAVPALRSTPRLLRSHPLRRPAAPPPPTRRRCQSPRAAPSCRPARVHRASAIGSARASERHGSMRACRTQPCAAHVGFLRLLVCAAPQQERGDGRVAVVRGEVQRRPRASLRAKQMRVSSSGTKQNKHMNSSEVHARFRWRSHQRRGQGAL